MVLLMSLHQSIEYEFDFEDEEKADEVFQKYISETNASKNAIHYDYLLTEDEGNFYVNELGEMNGTLNGRRSLVTDEVVIEGVLEDEVAEEMKRRYDILS